MYKDELKNAVYKIVDEMEHSMLGEIHEILCNDALDDSECVEEIVEIFEKEVLPAAADMTFRLYTAV